METSNSVVRRGKPLDSNRLKRGLNKAASIQAAAAFSQAIQPGPRIEQCPVCLDIRQRQLATIYGFSYVECGGCGSAYVVNPPTDADISAAYRSNYYTAANKALLANPATIGYRLSQVATPKVAFVVEQSGRNIGRWLDIGCGVGEVLAAARTRGFETLGIETNVMEAAFGREHFGLDIVEKYISPENIHEFKGRFEVISLFSVLEHVRNPSALLSTVGSLQRPSGTLVIETPHFPSLSAFSQMAAPNLVNRMMHPPLHLFLFSIEGVESMLASAGYTIKARWMFGQDVYELVTTLAEQLPIAGSRLNETLVSLTNGFQEVVDRHDLSDEMLIVAEKI